VAAYAVLAVVVGRRAAAVRYKEVRPPERYRVHAHRSASRPVYHVIHAASAAAQPRVSPSTPTPY